MKGGAIMFKKGGLLTYAFGIGIAITYISQIEWFSLDTLVYIIFGTGMLLALIKSSNLHVFPKNMKEINELDPFVFESYASQYLIKCGYAKQSQKTQNSHDWGADVKGTTVGGRSFVCQVKHSRKGRGQGKAAIEEVITAQQHYGAHEMVAMTNTHFTKQAKILARRNGVRLIEGNDIKRSKI